MQKYTLPLAGWNEQDFVAVSNPSEPRARDLAGGQSEGLCLHTTYKYRPQSGFYRLGPHRKLVAENGRVSLLHNIDDKPEAQKKSVICPKPYGE